VDLLQGTRCKGRAVLVIAAKIPGCLCPEGLSQTGLLGKVV
jgi:hypothetical protein